PAPTSLPLRRPSVPRLSLTAPPTTEIYTLSLHDALPILGAAAEHPQCRDNHEHRDEHETDDPEEHPVPAREFSDDTGGERADERDRKSTRLNSSHVKISYAVFCLKKKRQPETAQQPEHKK